MAFLCVASPGRAETSNKALAEALFQDGRELLEAGRVPEACAKFLASQRVEPKLGTLLNLAACHETEGKTASAWAEFTEGMTQASRAHQVDREEFARTHVAALEARLSRVAIAAPQANVEVKVDGVLLDAAIADTEFPVDPGEHTVTVGAPGKRAFSTKIKVNEGPGSQRIVVPPLEDDARGSTGSTAPQGEGAAAPPSGPSARRLIGWTAVALGAAGAAVGTGFGIRAFNKKADASGECSGDLCSQRGLDLYSESRVSANVSTVAFVTGAAAAAIAIYLLLASEPADAAPASAGLVGRW